MLQPRGVVIQGTVPSVCCEKAMSISSTAGPSSCSATRPRSPSHSVKRFTLAPSEQRFRGFNFFDDEDHTLFEVLCRGEYFIHGFRNRSLREHLGGFAPHKSRVFSSAHAFTASSRSSTKPTSYKYYLTEFCRHAGVVRSPTSFLAHSAVVCGHSLC